MNTFSKRLSDLEVIVFDCQATHSDPAKGAVFEIGWAKTKASDYSSKNQSKMDSKSFLLELPDGIKLSHQIKKITGIQDKDLQSAHPIKNIWPKLLTASQESAAQNKMPICPMIIHYARYEIPFLKYFHKLYNPDISFPFHIICTHQIIKRFFPGLPRKGLRAVAGYFGESIHEPRRSRQHAQGTAFIWSNIVKLFEEQERLSNFDDLLNWMNISSSSFNQSKSVRVYPMAKNYRQDLPPLPGIYRMLRANGDLLYIGKAKSLKHRVGSYFRQKEKHREHILNMLSQAKSLTYTKTKTALEAALRESDEIKVLDPPFNIALRLSEESPVFSTRNLKYFSQKPDGKFRIGPLPSKKYIEPLSYFMDISNGNISSITPDIINKTLAVPEEFAPDLPLFLEGLNEFKKQTIDLINIPVTFPILMKTGTFLWKRYLDKQAERQLQDELEKDTLVLKTDSPKKKKKRESFHWTPERIAKTLSHLIRIGTFQIRRSRWLYLLTESTLIWEKREKRKDGKNIVVFRNGLPYFEEPIPISQEMTSPNGNRKSPLEKQNNFDMFTYDRMRILTTEIRRILEEDRSIQLLLEPKLMLNSKQVKGILRWV